MTFGSPFAELAAAISALLTENETLRAQLAEQRQTVRGPHNFPRRAEQEDYIDYLLDMRIDDSKDPQLSRAATIVRQQITRIAELEAEVDRLMAVIANIPDASTHLQRLYTDPKSSSSLVAKAAGLAMGFERPKINANVRLDANILFDRFEARRLVKRKARLEVAAKVVDIKPEPAA
jgi:hypothetical protein